MYLYLSHIHISGTTRICLKGGSKHDTFFIGRLNKTFKINILNKYFKWQYSDIMTIKKKTLIKRYHLATCLYFVDALLPSGMVLYAVCTYTIY